MKPYLIILVLFIQYSGSSQELPEYYKRTKKIELIFPHYNYYENDFHFSNPLFNIGIKYNLINHEKKRGYYFGLSTNWYNQVPYNYSFLTTYSREVLYPYFGLFKAFKINKKIDFNFFGELNNRLGYEDVYIAKYQYEIVLDQRPLVDFGLSIGGNMNFKINSKWSINADVKHTYYVFRYYRGAENFPYGSTKNVLTFYFGIGYTFKKSKTQLQ